MLKRLYYIILQRLYVLKSRNKPCQGKVYMFHNVNDDGGTYSITRENFAEFIDHLTKNRKVVDIETLIKEKDPNNVVITFDDVYESVYRSAYPILKEKDLPYYLFVSNEYLNKEGYLSSTMLKEMLNDSKAFLGSHNYRHVLSRFCDSRTLKEDLKKSKEELEKEFSVSVDSFAFPYGSMYACSKENIRTASELFDYVFMTYAISYHEDLGNIIPRINMNDSLFGKEMQ